MPDYLSSLTEARLLPRKWLALTEHEFFGLQGPSATFKDRYGREGRSVRGLSVEEHLVRLRESLLPLAGPYGHVLSGALVSLEALRRTPSRAVEPSRLTKVSVRFRVARPPCRCAPVHMSLDGGDAEWRVGAVGGPVRSDNRAEL